MDNGDGCTVCFSRYDDDEHKRLPDRRVCKKCYNLQQKEYQKTPEQIKHAHERNSYRNRLQVNAFLSLWKIRKKQLETERVCDLCQLFVNCICDTSDKRLAQADPKLVQQWRNKEF